MLGKWYADWMIRWETALTTRDTNRVVRPLEWGFDWLADFSELAANSREDSPDALERMVRVNEEIVARGPEFYSYTTPNCFPLMCGQRRCARLSRCDWMLTVANPHLRSSCGLLRHWSRNTTKTMQ